MLYVNAYIESRTLLCGRPSTFSAARHDIVYAFVRWCSAHLKANRRWRWYTCARRFFVVFATFLPGLSAQSSDASSAVSAVQAALENGDFATASRLVNTQLAVHPNE